MYQFTNYMFTTDSKNDAFLKFVKEMLDLDEYDGKLVNEEDSVHFTLDKLYAALAKIKSQFPNEEFQVDGVWDTSSTAGELMDFQICCVNGELSGKCSQWYIEEDKCLYDTYEDLCESCDDNPPFTEEEFENWDESDVYYSLNSGDGPWVKQVPMIYDLAEYLS